jgi:tetratricopeptide (TPR) repeat protein
VRRTLYWKRLLIVVAAAVLSAGAVFALHRVQVRSQTSIFKDRAEKVAAAAEADPSQRGEAIALYRQYLKFNPGDREAYQKYAVLNLDDAAADPRPANAERAAAAVEDFLRNFRDHPAERQKLAELYLSMGQLQKLPLAKQHIQILLAAPGDAKNSVEVRELAAAVEFGLTPDNPDAAIDHLEKAVATGAAPVRTHVRLMELHNQNKKDKDRVNKITQGPLAALRAGRFERNLEARVAAARFEMVLKNLDIARGDLKVAFDALGGEGDADAQLARAELELAGAKAEDMPARNAAAEAHLRKAFAVDPRNVAVGLLLAEVLVRQGKRDEGVDVLKATAGTFSAYSDRYMILIDRLIDLGEQTYSASLVEGKLADPTSAPRTTLANYARGRLAVLKADWPAALKLLEDVAPNLVRVADYHKKAMVGLATCSAAMQNPDRQLDYCRQALRDDGGYVLAIIGEAEALVKLGRTDDAVQRFRLIVNLYQLASYRPELVRLELQAALAQPAETRDWRRFEEAAAPDAGKTAEIQIYTAEADVARGKAAEAAGRLREWLGKNPKDPKAGAVWVALARVADGGKPEAAEGVLKEAEGKVGNTVDIRLARAALLIARAKPTAPEELAPLANGADALPPDERGQLLGGLGQAMARVADRPAEGDVAQAAQAAARDAAIRYLRAAADLQPKDLMTRAMLLDQAQAAGKADVVAQAIREMAGIEGDGGPVGALATIAVRLPQVRAAADPAAGVKELRALAARVRDSRPGWSRVYVALGQLDELEGLYDAALENYNAAIERGERQEAVVRRAVDLYRLRQEDLKAVALLDRLASEVRLPDDLDRYRVIQRMLTATPRDARESIDRIAPFEASDYRLLQLRGSLLAAVRADADSLKAFRRAVELKDRLPETWTALVDQLVKQGQTGMAKAAVAEAKTKLVPPPGANGLEKAEILLALGGLHELIGDLPAALAYYQAAREAAPNELNPTRQLVQFHQRTGNGAQAEALLNAAKASAAPSVARWARRHLALTLIARPDGYSRRAEALALVEQNLAAAPRDSEDLKARATVWTVDPVTREQGISELRNFARRSDLTPDEFYLLGQLAFDQGKFAESAQHFALAARVRPGVAARHMVGLVRAYLALSQQSPPATAAASDMLRLAEDAAERLKTHFPASWEATREQARVLHRRSRERAARVEIDDAKKLSDEAVALVKKFPGWDAGPNLAARTGPLFEEMGLVDEAEAAYTKYLSSGEKNAHAPLAVLYIRQKRSDAAVQLARKYEKDTPPLLTARLMTGAARARRLDPVTEAEIGQFLDAALKDAAGKPELEAALIGSKAELLDAQGRYDDAIAEYRRSLAKGQSDLVVNNLSMLLALHAPKQADEAVQMMTDLINVRGPVPAYLDTRAVVYLVSSRPEQATKDLQMALVQLERPAYRFHLGWAIDLDAVKERQIFAVDELKRAKQIGLTAADLHPLEYKKYAELLTKYRLTLDEGK